MSEIGFHTVPIRESRDTLKNYYYYLFFASIFVQKWQKILKTRLLVLI